MQEIQKCCEVRFVACKQYFCHQLYKTNEHKNYFYQLSRLRK